MCSEHNGTDRKNSILTAAEEVFGDCGYAATTMEAVAEKAGISKGSIYNYFQHKQDLFQSVFERSFNDLEAQGRAILDSPATAVEKIANLVDFWFKRLQHHKPISQLVLEFWATAARQGDAGDLTKLLREHADAWRQTLAGVLAKGIEAGEFGKLNPVVAASLMMSILHGIEVQAMLDVGLAVDGSFIESLKGAILAALKAGTGIRKEVRP